MIAFEEAFEELRNNKGYDKNKKIGIFCGTCVLETRSLERFYINHLNNGKSKKIKSILSASQSRIIDTITKSYDIFTHSSLVSTACSSSTIAQKLAIQSINSGKIDYAVILGVDSLCELSYFGFYSLGAISASQSSPFSIGDYGITLGEAASVLIIGKDDKKHNFEYMISNVGVTSDAYNLTSPSPLLSSTVEAMNQACKYINIDDLDYVIAHGSGTELNDKIESKAIQKISKDNKFNVTSLKGQFGHTLGAAGITNTTVSLLALENKVLFPTLNFKEARSGCSLEYVPNEAQKNDNLQLALSNSFGFGGNNGSALVINKDYKALVPEENILEDEIVISDIDALIPNNFTAEILKNKIINCEYETMELENQLSFSNKYSTKFYNMIDFDSEEINLLARKNLKNYRKMDRLSKILNLVSTRLIRNSKLKISNNNKFKIGLLFGTASGPMSASREFIDLVQKDINEINPSLFQNTVLNASLGYLTIETNITGPSLMFTQNEIGGDIALEAAINFIKNKELDSAIVGVADELDHTIIKGKLDLKHTLSGENKKTLSAFSSLNHFYTGEGGISFIIEPRNNALEENRKPLARVIECKTFKSDSNIVQFPKEKSIQSIINEYTKKYGEPDLLIVNSSGLKQMDEIFVNAIKNSSLKETYIYSPMSLGANYSGLSLGLGIFSAITALNENLVFGMPYANNNLGIKITNKTISKDINLVFVLNIAIGGHIAITVLEKYNLDEK